MIRKVLQLSDRTFNSKQLPYEVIPVVVEILGDVYPEMQTKLCDIFAIIRNEEEIINSLRGTFGEEVKSILSQRRATTEDTIDESDFFDNIGLLPALKDFREAKESFPMRNVFPDEYVMRLYGTFGLDEDLISRLGRLEGVDLGESSFHRAKLQLTRKGKEHIAVRKQSELEKEGNIEGLSQVIAELYPPTDDHGKYDYVYKKEAGSFAVDPVKSRILGIIVNNKLVPEIKSILPNEEVSVILERTNFYCESGGQECDTGKMITSEGVTMDVSNVQQRDGRILHIIESLNASDKKLTVGDSVRVLVNSDRRTGNTIHHTATHLLNMSVRQVMKTVVYQKSSSVKEEVLRMELGIIGSARLDREHIKEIERQICEAIRRGAPVVTTLVQYDDIGCRTDIVTVPGEIYPEENLRLISIESEPLKSLELCCGTHVKDVNQLKDFCITNVRQVSRGTYQITALAGEAATRAVVLGRKMKSDVEAIMADLKGDKMQMENLESRTHRLKNILQQGLHKNFTIPYVVKAECLEVLNDINKGIRDASRETLKEFIEIEMNTVLMERPKEDIPFIVHNLSSSALMEDVKLQKATRLCPDRPILVMCVSGGQMKARACVPAALASDKFNAQSWLQEVAHTFKATVAPPKGQDAALVCNMKAIKVKTSAVEEQIEEALSRANDFARQNL